MDDVFRRATIRRHLHSRDPRALSFAIESDGEQVRFFADGSESLAECTVDDLLRLLNDSRQDRPSVCGVKVQWAAQIAEGLEGERVTVFDEAMCVLAAPHSGPHWAQRLIPFRGRL